MFVVKHLFFLVVFHALSVHRFLNNFCILSHIYTLNTIIQSGSLGLGTRSIIYSCFTQLTENLLELFIGLFEVIITLEF